MQTGDAAAGHGGRTALPIVIVTSVIRSTYQGQSHGGVYLVDLETGSSEQVLDWDHAGIDWDGRGGDRGLRGVAFWQDEIYLAASDEIFVFDPSFEQLRTIRNTYLGHCHEIFIERDSLYLTSCNFDSILEYNLRDRRFVRGSCLRRPEVLRHAVRLAERLGVGGRITPPLRVRTFDPNGASGPEPADTLHINNITSIDGRLYVSGRELRNLYCIEDGQASVYAPVPLGTHNAAPLGDGVIMNDTANDRVAYWSRDGRVRWQVSVPTYPQASLRNVDLAAGKARQGFGRGLALIDRHRVVAGSSPATVTVHDIGGGPSVTSVNLSMDVRNAVHGLAVWPYR